MSTISQVNYIHENSIGCQRDTLQRQLSHLDRKIAREGKSKIKRLEKEMGNIKKKIIKKIFDVSAVRRFSFTSISIVLIVAGIIMATTGMLSFGIVLGVIGLVFGLVAMAFWFHDYRLTAHQYHQPIDPRADQGELLSVVEKMVIKKNKPMDRLHNARCRMIDKERARLDKAGGDLACLDDRKEVLCLERAHSSVQVNLLNHPYTRP